MPSVAAETAPGTVSNPLLSPSSQPPTALTPGHRAAAFIDLYSKTLSKTLSTVSYDNFAACFPTMAENARENLRALHRAMIERVEGFAKRDFEEILRERNVIENLNALDDLLLDAQKRRSRAVSGETPPTPPHLLPASAILAAHLAPQLALQQSQLNAKLQTTQSQNASLFKKVLAQRAEIESLLDGLHATIKDLEAANECLTGEVPDLRRVTRDVEVEMSGI